MPWDLETVGAYHYCHILPTIPNPSRGLILVTGGTGYIGGRLIPQLQVRGYMVRVLTRDDCPEYSERWPGAEVVTGDALDPVSLEKSMQGVDTAYYLIHSMLLGPAHFEEADIQAAINFRAAAARCGVKRIIYLGGLGDRNDSLSPHLESRMRVARELSAGPVPVTVLRAAIIIGSGSAPYEILRGLVRNLPLLLMPFWSRTRCQPIAIRDVIKYLIGVLESNETSGRHFDIGGPDILTYEEMLRTLARLLGKKRFFLPFPCSCIPLYSYAVSLLTPVPHAIVRSLLPSCPNDVICVDQSLQKILPIPLITFRHALLRAMQREEQDDVRTRWSDSYPPSHVLAIKLKENRRKPTFTCTYALKTDRSRRSVFHNICRIGGKEGWFHSNLLWRMRGLLDRLLMGVGTSRGRRQIDTLRVNDVIDFWRVEEIEEDHRLLLRAEMKLPGLAWLEFRVDPLTPDESRLSVTAWFQTRSLFGHVYWYFFLPFHDFIFKDLIWEIHKRSSRINRTQ